MTKTQGVLFIVSAPSGTGKTSLIQQVLKAKNSSSAQLSISHTTRKKRSGEKNGVHYYFISHEEFINMIKDGAFLEYVRIFGHFYGTSRSSIEAVLSSGVDVFLDINWQGAKQIRKKISTFFISSIFILPPSKEELVRRLYQRGQESKQSIAKRIDQAVTEMKHYQEYDYLIINDIYEQAVSDLKNIVNAERLKKHPQVQRNSNIISKLLKD
ncbi:MAG: guanylate kinase [Candidatus Dasytiphilus stammeri]